MNLKSKIMQAIEQGLTNKQIVEAIPTTANYVVRVRMQYNAIAPTRIKSPALDKPKEGTASRAVYDVLIANPSATSGEIMRQVSASYGVIASVRKLFFGYKPRVNPWIAQPESMRSVELSELTL